jgi:AraC family transcriptional regulator
LQAQIQRAHGVTTVGEVTVDFGLAHVVDCAVPRNAQSVVSSPLNRIGLSLSPQPKTHGRFQVEGCDDRALGKLVFLPANIPFESHSVGGHHRLAGSHFTEEAFARATGRESSWSKDELSRSTDLKDARIAQSLTRLAQEALSPGFASAAVVEATMVVLMVDLARRLGTQSEPTPLWAKGGLTGRRLSQIEERIVAEEMLPPSVAELADLARLSPRHLLRGYRETMGENLRERLQREANSRACALLRSTELSIKEIAARLGFRAAGSFSTAFLRANGETPRDYRARHG